jgi:hypothetical protein
MNDLTPAPLAGDVLEKQTMDVAVGITRAGEVRIDFEDRPALVMSRAEAKKLAALIERVAGSGFLRSMYPEAG